jgi:hypothetical protein
MINRGDYNGSGFIAFLLIASPFIVYWITTQIGEARARGREIRHRMSNLAWREFVREHGGIDRTVDEFGSFDAARSAFGERPDGD